jgi:mRNA interferase HicA
MSIKNKYKMKSSEFIRKAKQEGWQFLRQGKGSHEIYTKGEKQVVIPNHGAKELGKGLENKLRKQMGL